MTFPSPEATMQDFALSMTGKTCLVTGATSGIGAVTARELAKREVTVILVGRNPERGEEIARSIRELSHNPSVHALTADLSSQAEVRRVAQEFLERYDRLHVLVNNAGAMYELRRESLEGLERRWMRFPWPHRFGMLELSMT